MQQSQEQIASAIQSMGYQVFKGGKFHWNSTATPDSSIKKDGKIHRWTDGWHGDLIDFIKVTQGVGFVEAKKIAENLLGQPLSELSSFKAPINNAEKPPISLSYLAQYELDRRDNFDKYSELLRTLLPSVKEFEVRKNLAVKYRIGYIKQSNKLLIPIFDIDGKWITSAKYTNTPYQGLPKIMFSADRKKIPFNLADMFEFQKNPDKPILITEGHKDLLNAIGNGFHAITSGGSGDLFRQSDLPLFKDLSVLICGDYDDAGKSFNARISEQLKPYTKDIKCIDWETLSILNGFKLHKGFDLTDYLCILHK